MTTAHVPEPTTTVPMRGDTPMPEDQAQRIGFHKHGPHEEAAIRRIRELGAQMERELVLLESNDSPFEADLRWTAIARTHWQQGNMAAVRAIARPAFF